ncbi:hypothetical protein RhiJN_08126 [Ceratobasidium sp. AG-Ba]|nr:hypothetical protein RhiJN_08126 [Ceratobasidium sp. AG-Ba]QRW08883.1 hypothetical protein RhiLY_07882 [Ceratobasidium sp. AG-Ba]
MQLQPTLARFAALVCFLASFTMLVHAIPFENRDIGTGCSAGCETGNQLVLTLTKLKAGVELNVGKIEAAVFNGTDPTQYVVAITALIQDTTAAVIKLEVDLTALLNGKLTEIVALLVAIINTTVKGLYATSGKITIQIFLGLVQQTDAALKALLVAVVNLGAAVLAFVGAGVDAVKLLQIGLTYCANVLGLN